MNAFATETRMSLRKTKSPLHFTRKSDKFSPACPPSPRKARPRSPNIIQQLKRAVPLGERGHVPDVGNRGKPFHEAYFIHLGILGEGSFGKVYKVYCLLTHQHYALKVLQKGHKTDCHMEVRRLDMVLGNYCCIQYHNAWEENDTVYILYELCDMSLAQYANLNHNICEDECINILIDMLSALKYMHNMKMLHMDIKPENILISDHRFDGVRYKLADFGLIPKDSEGDAKYVPKEALQANAQPTSDIFSLGASILELITDVQLPTHGHEWHALRDGLDRVFLEKFGRKMSLDFETLIVWMMAPTPEARPTAEQLMNFPLIKHRLKSKKPRVNYFRIFNEAHVTTRRKTPPRIKRHTPCSNDDEMMRRYGKFAKTKTSILPCRLDFGESAVTDNQSITGFL